MSVEKLIQKVLKGIEKNRFFAWINSFKIFIRTRILCWQYLYSIDQDEGKGREVVMRMLKNFVFKQGGRYYFVRNCLLIECKRSLYKPWVVFISPQEYIVIEFFLCYIIEDLEKFIKIGSDTQACKEAKEVRK